MASLCQYLYQLEETDEETIQKRVRQIYLYMAEYILENMLARWGVQYEMLHSKRVRENKQQEKPILFNQLTEVFTREQLQLQVEKQGLTTPYRIFLNKWESLKVIERIDKNTFKKIIKKKKND